MEQPDRLADAVAELAKDAQRLFLALARARRIAGVAGGPARASTALRRGRRGCPCRVAAEAVSSMRAASAMVALAVGERRTDIERMRMRNVRGLHGGQSERGAHVLASLGRVAPKHPEAHQRDLELDRQHRIDFAFERQRDRLRAGCRARPRGVASSPPARPLMPSIRGLRHRQEMVAMPRRGRQAHRAEPAARAHSRGSFRASGSAMRSSLCSAITSDLSTSEASRSRISSGISGRAPQTPRQAASSNPPAKTPSRSKSNRSAGCSSS